MGVERDNPSFTQFEVVEKCFGEQDRDHVVCHGFGMRPKDVRGPLPSREELTIKIREKTKENDDLKRRLDEMEEKNQEERDASAKKTKALEEKLNFLMNVVMGQQSNANGP